MLYSGREKDEKDMIASGRKKRLTKMSDYLDRHGTSREKSRGWNARGELTHECADSDGNPIPIQQPK